jgi:hypothetical protein
MEIKCHGEHRYKYNTQRPAYAGYSTGREYRSDELCRAGMKWSDYVQLLVRIVSQNVQA